MKLQLKEATFKAFKEIVIEDFKENCANMENYWTDNPDDEVSSRLVELDKYYNIKEGKKYFKIDTYRAYSGIYVLKEFLKINKNFQYDFKVDWNYEEMTLKIAYKEPMNYYKDNPEATKERESFIYEIMKILYLESFR